MQNDEDGKGDRGDNADQLEKTSVVASETLKRRIAEAVQAPPCLVLLVGPAAYVGKQWAITSSDLVVGRSVQSAIFVDDRSVSKSHAKISFISGEVTIMDLESTNRTIVNGQQIPSLVPVKLTNNDQIKTGNVIFKYLEKGSLEAVSHQTTYDRSQTDALTGIFNKGALLTYGVEAIKRCKTLKLPISVGFFDIDHFKKINDTYGHAAGDFVLRELASLISRKVIRSDDYFARYGGEEFVIVWYGSNLKQALEIGERIRHTVETHDFVYSGTRLPITISVGVSERENDQTSFEELVHRADTALYVSKKGGRNRVSSI